MKAKAFVHQLRSATVKFSRDTGFAYSTRRVMKHLAQVPIYLLAVMTIICPIVLFFNKQQLFGINYPLQDITVACTVVNLLLATVAIYGYFQHHPRKKFFTENFRDHKPSLKPFI